MRDLLNTMHYLSTGMRFLACPQHWPSYLLNSDNKGSQILDSGSIPLCRVRSEYSCCIAIRINQSNQPSFLISKLTTQILHSILTGLHATMPQFTVDYLTMHMVGRHQNVCICRFMQSENVTFYDMCDYCMVTATVWTPKVANGLCYSPTCLFLFNSALELPELWQISGRV